MFLELLEPVYYISAGGGIVDLLGGSHCLPHNVLHLPLPQPNQEHYQLPDLKPEIKSLKKKKKKKFFEPCNQWS